jgi:hypothetical protein
LSYASARGRIIETLRRLDERYQLIIRKKGTPKGPYVILLDYSKRIPYTLPQEGYFSIPDEYWRYGWNKSFSFPERYCYLINLYKGGDTRGRLWSDDIAGLSDAFGLNRNSISSGMEGLKRFNIIEIEYPDYPQEGGFKARGPIQFRLLGLYSPQILNRERDRLEKLYGKEHFKRATEYAEIVFKGNDIQVIEDIIKRIEEYGIAQVDRVFKIVSERAPDNPKRSYRYTVGILRGEETNKSP